MKKTQITALFQSIKKSFVSFISIIVFVALGISIFLGIRWNEFALSEAVDRYLDEGNYHHYQIAFAYGITEEDIELVKAIDGVDAVEGMYSAYGTSEIDGERYVLAAQSLTEQIDLATVLQGRMPVSCDETGIDQLFAEAAGLKIGDLLSFQAENDALLKEREFTVTAIVEHPSYFRKENDYSRGFCSIGDGSVDYYLLMSAEAFDKEAYNDCFSQILIRSEELIGLSTFGKEYEEKSAAVADRLEAFSQERAELRCKEITDRMDEKIEEAEEQFRKKREELTVLRDAAQTLCTQLEETDLLLNNYIENPDEANMQKLVDKVTDLIRNNPEMVEKIKPEIEAIESKLDKYIEDPDSLTEEEREIINTILEALNLSTDGTGATALKVSFEMVKSFADAYERDPEKAIEDLRGTLMMLLAFAPDLSAAEEQLAQRTEELRGEIAKLNGAIALLDGALGEESASAAVRLTRDTDELADLEAAVKEFQDAKQKRQDFVRYENWSVQKRTDNPSVATAKFYAQSSNKLCFSMSLLFVFVGLMVCYTSVSRNVNEAKVTTGVQKALGFRVREIMAYYMAYSVIAVIMGAVLGYLLGYFVIESIVNNSYAGLFSLGTIPNVYTVTDALVIAAAEIVLICIATFLPCRKHLKRPAVELMKGTSNGDGSTRFYWKFGFWKRLSLYTQTTINNLFGDGARVVATLVGIAGCTALIVMSMSLRFAITGTPEKHFSDVCVYDAYLVSDTSAPQAQENLRRVLSAENCSCISARQSVVYIEDENGELSKADIVVPESEENFREYIRLNDWKSKRALALPEEGVIISRTYEKYHDVKIGDTIRLMDATGVYHECVVAGVSEHYLSTIQLTMSRDYYEKVMNTPFVENVLYINYGDTDVESLQEKLRNTEGYFSLTDECAKWTAKFSEIASTTMLIIYIGLFLSTAMALLVLLNLNIVCVNEKKNELIIMRINGFSNGAVKKYVYRDNIFLTVTGIIIGTISGIGFSQWMLSILQKNGDNFYTKPNIIVILTAVGLASLFSLITNLIALRKIDKLKISDLKR